MLRQIDILKAVIALLKTKYPAETTSYYTDEIVNGFKQPCFFIKLIKSKYTETKNTNSNNLSIILTYYSDAAKNKQLIFLDLEDTVNELFGTGFKVSDRFLHIKSVAAERIGEDSDILQLTIAINYLDSTGYDGSAGYDLMQELNMAYKNKN
ncbi:MAG: phage tail terminator family protein [Acidaminococcaceae bacterium]